MLLEVLNGKSSIIRGSLVLEPAAHSRETFEELPKKRGGKEEEKLDSSSTLLLSTIFHPYLQLVVNQLNFATSVHMNCDHLKMFQIGPAKTLFWQSHCCQPSQNIIKARVIALHCNDKTLKCVVSSAAKHEKCEISLAGFPANDGVNFAQMMARICANCWLSHFHLNRCVKTTGFSACTKTRTNAIHV